MNRWQHFLLWLSVLLAPAYAGAQESTSLYLLRDKLPTNYWYSRLPNGLHLLVIEDNRVPRVQLSVCLPGGYAGQYTGYAGVPEVLSRLLPMHSAAYVDGYNYRRALQEATVQPTMQVLPQGMLLQGACLKEAITPALKVLFNTLQQPPWDTLYVGKALELCKQTIEAEALEPARYQQQQVLQVLWGSLYRFRERFPEFYKLRSNRITVLADYCQEHFQPEHTLIVVQGAVLPQEARLAVDALWGSWTTGIAPRNYRAVTQPLVQDTLLLQLSEQQETPLVTVAWQLPTPKQSPRGYYAALLLEELLRMPTGFGKRVFQHDWLHGHTPAYEASGLQSSLRISQLVSVARIPHWLQLLQAELAKCQSQPPFTAKELEQARQQWEIRLRYLKDDPSLWGQWQAQYWSLHGQLYSPIQFMDSLRAVRPADMQRLLERYLHAQPMVTAVLLNSNHAQQDFLTAYFDKDYVRQRQPQIDSTTLLAAAQAKAQASLLQPLVATSADSTRARAGISDTLATLAAATPDSLLYVRDADGKPLYARVSPDIPTVKELASYAIYYDFGKLLPDSSAEEIISRVVLFLNLNPGKSLVIRSHTDSPGSELANLQISERRAILLKQYIVSTYRIMPQRIFVKAMGEAKPAVQETDAATRRLNRRIEFDIR